jgi:hypothetical protein
MRALVRVVVIIVLSGFCSWLLAWYSCTSLLLGLRVFDFVCGHNTWLQMLPSFILFAVIFSVLVSAARGRIRRG